MSNFLVRRQQFSIASAIVSIALVLRVVFVLFYPAQPLAGRDPEAYWSFAEGISMGKGFTSEFEPWLADRPPLYAYFLAVLFCFLGKNEITVFLVQAVLGSFAAGLFYLCAFRILGAGRGFVVGLSSAMLPAFLLFTKQILSEQLYLVLFVIYLCAFLLPISISSYSMILSGVLFGLIALTRREALLPASLIGITLIWLLSGNNRRRFCSYFSIWVIIAIVTISPWLIRNWQIFDKPLLSSSAGWNFMVGNNPVASGAYTPPPADWSIQFEKLGELERDQKAWNLSLDWIQNYPGDFIQLLPKKIYHLWSFDTGNSFLTLADLFVYFFASLGIIRLIQRPLAWQFVAAISLSLILSTTLIGLVFVGGWRYHFIAYLGLLLLGSIGIPDRWNNYLLHTEQALSNKF